MRCTRIIKVTQNVRNKIEQWWGNYDLNGACAISSYVLARSLKYNGYAVDFVLGRFDGDFHCWVEYRNNILDITATQFGLPPVYIVKNNSPLYKPYVRNRKAMCEILKDWPPYQKPQTHYKSKPIINIIKNSGSLTLIC